MRAAAFRRLLLAATAIATSALVGETHAQPAPTPCECRAGDAILAEKLDGHIRDRILEAIPRLAAMNEQDASVSATGTDATVINTAGFTNLLSAAFDQTVGGQGNEDNEGVTLNVNPFLLAVAYDSGVYYDQIRYERWEYDQMRRFGGSVTFGGRGDAFDRDGDGEADEALESEALDDIVTWDLRYRVWGSRDRRERCNYDRIFDDVPFEALEKIQLALSNVIASPGVAAHRDPQCRHCVDWDALIADGAFKLGVDEAVRASLEAHEGYVGAVEAIENSLLVTLAVTGVERKAQFGSDKIGAGLRVTWRELSANVDWMQMDGMQGSADVNEVRIGAQYARQILKDLVGAEGIDASLALAVELFDDSADVNHDATVKIQGKLAIPLMEGVTVPLSVTWANHEDLLSSDDTIVGRFGISLDTSALMDLAGGGA